MLAINVEQIEWQQAENQFDKTISFNYKILGPLVGDKKTMQDIKQAIADNKYALSSDQQTLTVCGKELKAETNIFKTQMIQKKAEQGINAAITSDHVWVVLDSRLTPALLEKSRLRALEREVMKLRKQLNLTASDHITISLTGSLHELALRNSSNFCNNTHSRLLAAPEERAADAETQVSKLNKETELQGKIFVYGEQPTPSALLSAGTWRVAPQATRRDESVRTPSPHNI